MFGAAIYRLAEQKPLWLRIPLVITGGFVSHYILDSVASYHKSFPDTWYGGVLLLIQMIAVLILWFTSAAKVKHTWQMIMPPELLAGLWAWLSWDWERIVGSNWLHLDSCKTWAPRFFSECSSNPWTALWEVALVVGLTILVTTYSNKKASA